MTFKVKGFPHREFQKVEEYEEYIKEREVIKDKLDKKKQKANRVIKVVTTIKADDPIVQKILNEDSS